MACHLYNQALFFKNTIPSLSMVASVMAIEKLMNYNIKVERCRCGAFISIDKCDDCGAPIYGLRRRFLEFMASYSFPDKDLPCAYLF